MKIVHSQSLPHTYYTLFDTRLVFPIRETAGHKIVGLTWIILGLEIMDDA